jgi:multidrug resistance efflux pump
MLESIVLTYCLLVWLLFIKLKVFPWNIKTQVGVVAFGLAGLATLVFTINVTTPQSGDVRVINYVVEVVPRVTGRIIEVPVEGNTLVRKGQVLARIDPEPFLLKVRELEAQLVTAEAHARELTAEMAAAKSNSASVQAQLQLARTRVGQAKSLARDGAGSVYDVQSYEAQAGQLQGSFEAAKAAERKVGMQLDAISNGDQASVAAVKAALATAKWELEQTILYAPDDGYVVNLQVRPGSYAAALPLKPIMSFVETHQRVLAFFDQNQLTKVKSGDHVEVALKSRPGKIFTGKVESIIWANAQGQMQASGLLPTTAVEGAHELASLQYAVRFRMDDQEALRLAMGARGEAAIYTDSLKVLDLVRMVILRVKSKVNYLVFKLE